MGREIQSHPLRETVLERVKILPLESGKLALIIQHCSHQLGGSGVNMHLVCVCVCTFSCVRLLATPWAAALQASLSLEFSRQDYWSGLLFPFPIWAHIFLSTKCEGSTSQNHGRLSTVCKNVSRTYFQTKTCTLTLIEDLFTIAKI